MLTAYKTLGKGVIVMVNSNEGYAIMDEIARAIAKEYDWPGFLPQDNKSVNDSLHKADYPGSYYNKDSIEMKIIMLNNQPQLVYQQQQPIPLQKSTGDFYFSPTMNFKIHLKDNELRFEQAGESQVFIRRN